MIGHLRVADVHCKCRFQRAAFATTTTGAGSAVQTTGAGGCTKKVSGSMPPWAARRWMATAGWSALAC